MALENEHALLLVCGSHIAKMFEYQNGEVTPLPVAQADHTIYTDEEGFRAPDHETSITGTPSNYEKKVTGEWDRFVHQLQERAEGMKIEKKDFDSVYLFAPQESINQIKDALPKEWLSKLKFEYTGNFTKAKPAEILEIIDSRTVDEPTEVWTDRAEQAEKILEHPHIRNSEV